MSRLVELPVETYVEGVFSGFHAGADFDIGTARALMWLSQLAYEARGAPAKLEPVGRRWELDHIAPIAHRHIREHRGISTRGVLARGHGATFIAFAGTDPLTFENWLTNLRLGARASDLHRGFQAAVEPVWDGLAAVLRTETNPIYLAGHSLGGALAIVAAERAARELGVVAAAIYTFGAPRAGSEKFLANYNAAGLGLRTFRLVHGHDIVPSLPPAALGFRHVGRMLHCRRGGHFSAQRGLSEPDNNDPPFADTVRNGYRQRIHDLMTGDFPPTTRPGWLGQYHRYILPPTVGDHLPERYRLALRPTNQAS